MLYLDIYYGINMLKFITISKLLIQNSKNFLTIEKIILFESIKYLFSKVTFIGWGRKKSGIWAEKISKFSRGDFLLLEDGFIRSFGLGVDGSPSFSIVKDNMGIYYDATRASKLEEILNTYDFKSNKKLMSMAKEAKSKIIEYKISKYNNFKEIDLSYLDNEKDFNKIELNLKTLSKLLGHKVNRTRLVTLLLLKCGNLEFLHDIGYVPYDELMQNMLFPKFDLEKTSKR